MIFQDGDVYGRTVNLAALIASYAQAGEAIASADTVSASRETTWSSRRVVPS